MKKYDSYKDSGVEWIGEIPSHWDVNKLFRLFKINTGFTPSTSNSEFYENGNYDWINISDLESKYVSTSKTKLTEKAIEGKEIVPKGSLMYSFKLSVGKMAFADKDLFTNEAIFSIFPDDEINLNYYYYLLDRILIHNSNENIYGAKILNQELIKASKLIVPSKEEQTTISNYLDQKTTQIDDLIAKKERLIQLLEEERTAIINQAVTKGLDPSVPMKDSGIEWLGEIPEHWNHSSLKWYSKIYSGGTPSKDVEEFWINGTIPWLNSGCVNQWDITEVSDYITEDAFNNSSAKWIPSKSLVIALAGQGKTKGMVAQVQFDTTCNQSLGVIVPNEKIHNRFLQYWLKKNYFNIRSLGGGDKRDGLNLVMIGGIPIPIPPLDEQASIALYLDNKNFELDSLNQVYLKEIELLKEYKTALISEVVTGKVDVRNEKLS